MQKEKEAVIFVYVCSCLYGWYGTVGQNIFGAYLFSTIFGLVILGRKFFAAEIWFCKVQCDSVYRWQQYRLKI